ncbi:MAG: TetR/AcrR family transcriptional regulator [Lentisphaeria bacterium]|nr:TetR/AcrR family transcriptional regulator [Lentisphaeria bacterium]NQZ67181.1 TetR/AcrR family transcriptional regulator [Lentisphaeria bacterium]
MQKRALETKAAILKHAVDEFSEKGLHGGRVDAIAERAGVNKQRIYAYYENKDKLFEAVLHHCFLEIRQREAEGLNLQSITYKELTEALLDNYFKLHRDFPHLWRIIAWENLEGGNHAHVLTNIKAKFFKEVQAIFNEGKKASYFPEDVNFETYMFTVFSVTGFYFSNQKTLKHSLSAKLFTKKNQQNISQQILSLLGG